MMSSSSSSSLIGQCGDLLHLKMVKSCIYPGVGPLTIQSLAMGMFLDRLTESSPKTNLVCLGTSTCAFS